MTDVLRIVGIALVFSVLLVILRKEAAPYGAQLAIGLVVVLLLSLLRPISQLIDALGSLAQGAGIRSVYLGIVLKAIGIAAMTSIGAELCRDAGEDAAGQVVELAGKVFIMLLALPVVTAIIDLVVRLLPG